MTIREFFNDHCKHNLRIILKTIVIIFILSLRQNTYQLSWFPLLYYVIFIPYSPRSLPNTYHIHSWVATAPTNIYPIRGLGYG